MRTARDVRQLLVAASRKHSRVRHEAEDVAHDIIVSALRRGLALEDDWLTRAADASARQHCAFVARGAARRRAREVLCALEPPADAFGESTRTEGVAPASLPSALLTTLLLLSLGLTKAEVRSALGLTDAALRKRLQGLRERGPFARPRFAKRVAVAPGVRRVQLALVALLASRFEGYRGSGRLVAVTDDDGHGILFSEVLTNGPIAATPHCFPTHLRGQEALVKGRSC